MVVIGLFILSASLLATMWAGQISLLHAALVWFVAAIAFDLVTGLTIFLNKYIAAKSTEVMFGGLAQGSLPQGLRNQIRNAARKAGEQAGKPDSPDKAD